MAIIYATLIIKGKKTFADFPDRIKDKQPLYDHYMRSQAVVFMFRNDRENETDYLQCIRCDWFSDCIVFWWLGCRTCNPFNFYGA